jgi:hypothetical protein
MLFRVSRNSFVDEMALDNLARDPHFRRSRYGMRDPPDMFKDSVHDDVFAQELVLHMLLVTQCYCVLTLAALVTQAVRLCRLFSCLGTFQGRGQAVR